MTAHDISVIKTFSELRILNLRDQGLDRAPDLEGMHKLEQLFLHFNKIKSFSLTNKLPNLWRLDLSHNKITSLKEFRINKECRNIKFIYLYSNQISDLYNLEPFSNLPNLDTVDLSNNLVKELNIATDLPQIRKLILSHNQIDSIINFKNLPMLEIISLKNSKNLRFELFKLWFNLKTKFST